MKWISYVIVLMKFRLEFIRMLVKELPIITVAVISYNNAKYTRKCIESVLAQDVQGIELIVLDDASTDNSDEVISEYLSDERLTYIRNEENLGMVANSDKAYRSGSGKYFSILPSDDFYYPGHLSKAIEALEEHPECVLAYSPCFWVDDNDCILELARHPGHMPFSYFGGRNELADLLVYDNYISPPAAVMRRKEFVAAGLLDPQIKGAGDWDMWTRLAQENTNFIYLNKPTVGYRIHTGQVSNEFYSSNDPLDDHLRIVEKVLINSDERVIKGKEERIWNQIDVRLTNHADTKDNNSVSKAVQIKNELVRIQTANYRQQLIDTPLISFVITTFNQPALLQKSLVSIASQEYTHWELLLVNDAGENIESLAESIIPVTKLRYFCHNVHTGTAEAIRSALTFATGQVVCYLEEGMQLSPEYLQEVVKKMKLSDDAYKYISDNDEDLLLCHRDYYDQLNYHSPVRMKAVMKTDTGT